MALASNLRFKGADRWAKRIQRIQELREKYSAAEGPLCFYEHVLEFQRHVGENSNLTAQPEQPLREQIDIENLSSEFPELLDLVVRYAPVPLATRARELQSTDQACWRAIVESGLVVGWPDLTGLDPFFARACLQPAAEAIQLQLPETTNYSKAICPICSGVAQLAILRPEGEGASRWLQCSFCLREWLFRRILCPRCGEEDKEKLPSYSAEEFKHIRVEACETCGHYLRAVDVSVDGLAEPLIDEAAAVVLDVWAGQQGYTKIVPNLIGF